MADDAGLGANSVKHSSTAKITLTKGDIAHISGLDDVYIPPQLSDADVMWKRAACVYSTQKNGYRVMLDHATSTPNKKTDNKYDIEWNPSGINGSGDALPLRPGVPVTVKRTVGDKTLCSRNQHVTEASLTIKIPKEFMKNFHTKKNAGSITVLMSPN
jgi:hypothetical protein